MTIAKLVLDLTGFPFFLFLLQLAKEKSTAYRLSAVRSALSFSP